MIFRKTWVLKYCKLQCCGTSIKSIASDTEVFKKTLKRFLMDNSFYSVDEFINFKE